MSLLTVSRSVYRFSSNLDYTWLKGISKNILRKNQNQRLHFPLYRAKNKTSDECQVLCKVCIILILSLLINTPLYYRDDLSSLKYQSLFIKEVMRMYSIVPLIGRLTDEPMTFDGATIPANSIVELNIHVINHRKDVWPDHDVRVISYKKMCAYW